MNDIYFINSFHQIGEASISLRYLSKTSSLYSQSMTLSLFTNIYLNVQYGLVDDLGNGNYSGEICPIKSGAYLLEVRYLGPNDNRGKDTKYFGVSVGSAPFSVLVAPSNASGQRSHVDHLNRNINATFPSHFLVTVKDHYDNLVVKSDFNITLTINHNPAINVTIINYHNGTCYVQYVPIESGISSLEIEINQKPVIGSPFEVHVFDVVSDVSNTYAIGPNLYHGKKY